MKFVKAIVVAGVAVVSLLGAGACSHSSRNTQPQYVQQYDFDCDHGDYIQRDTDCGYYDGPTWYYYPWTSSYGTTYPPAGWYPPAKVRTQFDQTHKTKNVPNPKYTVPQNRKTVAPAKTTTGYKAPGTNTYKAPTAPKKVASTRR